MKNSTNGNMYEETLDETWELFGAHLGGARFALVCVVSEQALDERSRAALNSSMAALSYGRNACTFVTTEYLDEQALFLLLEGLDPLNLIVSDKNAAQAVAATYRCEIPLDEQSRVFGRTTIAFKSFSTMLDDGQDKQVAWALLKKLPKFAER